MLLRQEKGLTFSQALFISKFACLSLFSCSLSWSAHDEVKRIAVANNDTSLTKVTTNVMWSRLTKVSASARNGEEEEDEEDDEEEVKKKTKEKKKNPTFSSCSMVVSFASPLQLP